MNQDMFKKRHEMFLDCINHINQILSPLLSLFLSPVSVLSFGCNGQFWCLYQITHKLETDKKLLKFNLAPGKMENISINFSRNFLII